LNSGEKRPLPLVKNSTPLSFLLWRFAGLGDIANSLDVWDRTIHLSYDPREDITSYELALILGYFTEYMGENWIRHNIFIRRTKWEVIPDEVKRHFRVV
jgi:hypothetical protein